MPSSSSGSASGPSALPAPPSTLSIGELSARTGVATSALRYYEDRGLLAPVAREGGRRRYDEDAVAVVGVVLLLADLGFTLEEIHELRASRATAPDAWRELAERKRDELDRRIADARAAREAIDHALLCPKLDPVDCPNFWAIVGRRVEGTPLSELE